MNTGDKSRCVTVRMTDQLYEQIHARPDVNWSLLARLAFQLFLNGQLVLTMTPEGPVLRPAPGETEPRTEKWKKQ